MALCGLLGLQGGYPFALCGFSFSFILAFRAFIFTSGFPFSPSAGFPFSPSAAHFSLLHLRMRYLFRLCLTALPTSRRWRLTTRLGRSAPSAPCRRMLPGCPTPRPPSCAGRGWCVGPPPTELVINSGRRHQAGAKKKNTTDGLALHGIAPPPLFVCCSCHPSFCPCVLYRPPARQLS